MTKYVIRVALVSGNVIPLRVNILNQYRRKGILHRVILKLIRLKFFDNRSGILALRNYGMFGNASRHDYCIAVMKYFEVFKQSDTLRVCQSIQSSVSHRVALRESGNKRL